MSFKVHALSTTDATWVGRQQASNLYRHSVTKTVAITQCYVDYYARMGTAIKVVSLSKSSLWRCLCQCAMLIASHTFNHCSLTLITLKDKNSYPHFTLEQLRNLSRGALSVSGLQGLEPRPFDSSDGTAVQTLFRLRSEPKDFSAFIPNINYSDFSKYLFLNQHMDSLK